MDEGASDCSHDAKEIDINDIEDYQDDFDGDSITDYDGNELDIESQHQQHRKSLLLTPPSEEAPQTHVEFDPLELGRASSHRNSKVSGEEQSSSGKNSVLSFSEKSPGSSKSRKANKEKNNSRVKTIVRGETRRIRRWKLASIIVVVVVGLLFSLGLFWEVYKSNVEKSRDTTPSIGDDPLFYRAVFDFESTANKVLSQSVEALEEISKALTAQANDTISSMDSNSQTSFPFVTLPNFPELAQDLSEVGMVDYGGVHIDVKYLTHNQLFKRVFWAPIIDPSSKVDWEKYSIYHQGWLMDTDLEEQQELEEFDGGNESSAVDIQTASAMFLAQEKEEYPAPEEMPVNISPVIHTDLLPHPESSEGSKMTMTSEFYFSPNPNGVSFESYLPAWQCLDFDSKESGPEVASTTEEPELACDASFVNFDLFSWFSPASAAIKDARSIEMDNDFSSGESESNGTVHVWNDFPFDNEDGSEVPTSLFLRVPVYGNRQTKDTVGYVFALLNEEVGLFRESALKGDTANFPLCLVVKEERNGRSSPAKKRTYEVRGDKITFMGEGDRHDEEYDDKVYRFKLRTQSEESTSSTLYSLYPTEDFFRYANLLSKKGNQPMMTISERYPAIPAVWSASLVASVFAVILIMFVCYDNSVEDRQRKLLRQAERTDAIVGSMFPANIQGRLMMIDDDTIESSQRQRGLQKPPVDQNLKEGKIPALLTGFEASTHTTAAPSDDGKASTPLNNSSFHTSSDSIGAKQTPFLTKMGRKHAHGNWNRFHGHPNSTSEHKAAPDESILRFGNTKPMADFYPNTTILMCDIAGFTAWSSARAPADVFRLLETIYGAFDDIARAEKVFKVETVGDCYVACAGLPVRQPKHAVIMAKFAKKTLKRYETLIKKLETYLGPDTVELGLRMGIHSGPVTAGVLRGDKTRFQLFGDTVNTASRMESTGRVNMIQVSPQTANLLKEEGLGKWVVPRENLVSVKGKGKMQTYWLLRSTSSMSSSLSQASAASPMGSPRIARSSNAIWKIKGGPQPRRNSMGASNASWETSSTGTQSSGSVHSHPQRRHSNENGARNSKERRLIEWMVETFMKSLKKIATHRAQNAAMYQQEELLDGKELSFPVLDPEAQIIEEIKEVIPIRQIEPRPSNASTIASLEPPTVFDANNQVTIPRVVERQLRDYITVVSLLYHNHAFHNFEHCAHVLMSVLKLLSRILESKLSASDSGLNESGDDHAYGITSDPLLEFACLFSALIHDVDHSGVTNAQLVKENTTTAIRYNNRSVAEQHSIAVSWSLLMQPCYRELRDCIYRTQREFDRFRQLVVNSVMATDIMDRELKKFRDNRWEKAFDLKNGVGVLGQCTENCNRMATVVIEHMIQASDVAHTMQHWHVYLKFNERLFREKYQAYRDGREEKDPSEYWYEGELGFFKFYIIPLAVKLKECGVFGVSGDEYVFHAESNRSEWALKGKEIVEEYMGRASRDSSRNSSRSNSPDPMSSHQLLQLPEGKASSFRSRSSYNGSVV